MIDLEIINNKSLFRDNFHVALREDVQPNFGRVQQKGVQALIRGREFSHAAGIYRAKQIENLRSGMGLVTYDPADQDLEAVWPNLFKEHRKPSTNGFYLMNILSALEADESKSRIAEINKGDANFVNRANRLAAHGQVDSALDLVYDYIDNLLTNSEFNRVNSILRNVALADASSDVLLGLLTSTLPARRKLWSRSRFYNDVELEFRRRGEWEEGLLTGLQPG
ncbi:MAG TPA: hypothetical protein VHB20_04665 [Verrucomicrobiae bacterium]|jgi:hypothetical protein|nr:hypothetical protein [Verrucomicrobiae bacterium]